MKDEGSGKLCAVIEPYGIFIPTQDSNLGGWNLDSKSEVVIKYMKSLHISLNIPHLSCKPNNFMSSFTPPLQVFLALPLHFTLATFIFLQADTCIVPSQRTDWGLRAFAVAGPSCWNELPVELRDLTVSPATFAKHLKTHLFRVGFF